jgi:hypothetical protein
MNLIDFQFDQERNRYVIRSLTERNEEIATFREITPLPDNHHFSGFQVQETPK